jgi:hypothetical protein
VKALLQFRRDLAVAAGLPAGADVPTPVSHPVFTPVIVGRSPAGAFCWQGRYLTAPLLFQRTGAPTVLQRTASRMSPRRKPAHQSERAEHDARPLPSLI